MRGRREAASRSLYDGAIRQAGAGPQPIRAPLRAGPRLYRTDVASAENPAPADEEDDRHQPGGDAHRRGVRQHIPAGLPRGHGEGEYAAARTNIAAPISRPTGHFSASHPPTRFAASPARVITPITVSTIVPSNPRSVRTASLKSIRPEAIRPKTEAAKAKAQKAGRGGTGPG